MNQILEFSNFSNSARKKKSKLFLYKIFFIFSIISLLIFIFLFILYTLFIKKNYYNSKNLANSFSVSHLYSSNSLYSVNSNIDNSNTTSSSFVIGIIKIDKLKLDYPILYSVSDELLKIAPCRFAGPMPNEIGNLCIAGHNYIDNTFFAKISSLEINDTFFIYDLSGNVLEYVVFEKYEIESTDLSCTSQETNGKRIVTLMTCNSLKGTRIIVRGIEEKI